MCGLFDQVFAFPSHEDQAELKLVNVGFFHCDGARKQRLDLILAVFCRLKGQALGEADEIEIFIPLWIPKQTSQRLQRGEFCRSRSKLPPFLLNRSITVQASPLHPGRGFDGFEELP